MQTIEFNDLYQNKKQHIKVSSKCTLSPNKNCGQEPENRGNWHIKYSSACLEQDPMLSIPIFMRNPPYALCISVLRKLLLDLTWSDAVGFGDKTIFTHYQISLTHWGRGKMTAILQTTLSRDFLEWNIWIMIQISMKFVSRIQSTILQHCFR